MLLGLYLFESYRSHRLVLEKKAKLEVGLFERGELVKQLGTRVDGEKYKRKAKQLVRRWHGELCTLYWLSCPNQLSEDGETLVFRPAKAVAKGARIRLPGVLKNFPRPRPTGPEEEPKTHDVHRRSRTRPSPPSRKTR